MNGEFPASLLKFIRSCVPSFQAAELLVFLHHHPSRRWTANELSEAIRPVVIAPSTVQEQLSLFGSCGIVREIADAFEFAPVSDEVTSAVGELARAYNERPVTLIRTIYSLADLKVQSFADSFRLRPDPEEDA